MSFHRGLIAMAPLLPASLSAGPVCAAAMPLRAPGPGMSAPSLPDYRGPDQSSHCPLPFPCLVDGGTFVKADHNGIRGTLFDSDRIELNVGVGVARVRGESSTRVEAVE